MVCIRSWSIQPFLNGSFLFLQKIFDLIKLYICMSINVRNLKVKFISENNPGNRFKMANSKFNLSSFVPTILRPSNSLRLGEHWFIALVNDSANTMEICFIHISGLSRVSPSYLSLCLSYNQTKLKLFFCFKWFIKQ